jgi:hypothetical protein
MTYYVFTSYPDRPVSGLPPSNRLPTIGFCNSESDVMEICGALYPDKFCVSLHPTKRDAKRFVETLIRGQSQYPFKNFGEVV